MRKRKKIKVVAVAPRGDKWVVMTFESYADHARWARANGLESYTMRKV